MYETRKFAVGDWVEYSYLPGMWHRGIVRSWCLSGKVEVVDPNNGKSHVFWPETLRPALRDGEGKIIGADGLSATAAYTPTPTNTPPVTPNDCDPGYDPKNETAPAGGAEYFPAVMAALVTPINPCPPGLAPRRSRNASAREFAEHAARLEELRLKAAAEAARLTSEGWYVCHDPRDSWITWIGKPVGLFPNGDVAVYVNPPGALASNVHRVGKGQYTGSTAGLPAYHEPDAAPTAWDDDDVGFGYFHKDSN